MANIKVQKMPTIRRLPTYLYKLSEMHKAGVGIVATPELARYMNLAEIVIRKDLAITGVSGQPGVGYKVTATANKLTMNIGFSHPVEFDAPEGITFAMAGPLEIVVKGFDRQKVGQAAASIKALKPVEPYHGYGIHYKDEVVIRKEGKTAGK